ncbi:D-alanyl-D-alanine carboxypeptidase family protein [Aureimonas populi]|uniref:serine-type D-Ala-D-Ala carboxypeptidase n=1 Tax=Aureimonas populi TaxID=1701758 RepID=A0ABW5CIZ6_9HYPH|nr:D-alanyl-D-alanine carboxypeptidase family protein [Aureimonas populi]
MTIRTGWPTNSFARAAFLAAACLWAGGAGAQGFVTTAPTAILKDFATGTVLFEKDADEQIPPASLVKLMTVAVIFGEIEAGRLSLDDEFHVSEYAWRTGGASSGGSTMFLPLNSQVSVDELIKGIIIQSGNDATIVAAEGIAGSVEAFAAMMNRKGAELGLTGSTFANPHGLPDPDQRVTMRDLTVLAEHIIRDYPQYYPLFSETEFTFNGITQRSRNPLLALGADGLKTGHTSEAGFGLVASAQENGRRIVLGMSGMQTAGERAEEARKMMTYGLRSFQTVTLLEAGASPASAEVLGGVEPSVELTAAESVEVLASRGTEGEFEIVAADLTPLTAPVAQGQPAGIARVTRGGETVIEVPLVAARAVEQAPFLQRSWDMARGYAREAGRAAYAYVSGLIW